MRFASVAFIIIMNTAARAKLNGRRQVHRESLCVPSRSTSSTEHLSRLALRLLISARRILPNYSLLVALTTRAPVFRSPTIDPVRRAASRPSASMLPLQLPPPAARSAHM